jgi:ribosome-associated protein
MAPERTGSFYAHRVAAEETLHVRRGLDLPLSEISWRATTSGGPGGQHANRTLSRVEVLFDVAASPTLGPRQRSRLLERLGPVVRASASESRSQARNRQLALERLASKLSEGLRVPTPRTPTRPTKGSQMRRVEAKRRRAQTKRGRRPPREDE